MTLAMVLCLLLASGCENVEGQEEEAVEEVQVAAVDRQVEAFGVVSVEETVSVSLDVATRIMEKQVQSGQIVKEGDVVLRLDLAEHHHAIEELEGELRVLRAEIEAQRASLDLETARLAQELHYAERELAQSLDDYQAGETLFNAGAIPREELTRYRQQVEAREKKVQDVSLQLDQKADAQQLQVSRRRAETLERRMTRLQEKLEVPFLEDDRIVCHYPRAVVVELEAIVGDRIESGQRLLKMMNLETLSVKANVLEEFVRDVEVGAAVTLIPDADRNRTYHGRVETLAGAASVAHNETVVPITVSVKDADAFLRPGFNVDLLIEY